MKIKTFMVAVALSALVGCGDDVSSNSSKTPLEKSTDNKITTIKHQAIVGEVRKTKFMPDKAILDNGTLTLRQGKEFFADVSVQIYTFDHKGVEGKTFNSSTLNGASKPHVILSIKSKTESLPDSITLLSDYDLILNFGKKENLGIPFSIKLVSKKHGTHVEGKAFATYMDVKLVNGEVDVQLDSFDTLRYLAEKYISKHNNQLKLGKSYDASYVNYSEDKRKSGFVGYQATTTSGKEILVKIQLLKDDKGWRVVNQLSDKQIHSAHPVFTDIKGSMRTVENAKAEVVAAQKLETYLNEKNIIPMVRATKVNCYLTKAADKASCRAIYGLKDKDAINCHDKNYLLANDGKGWKVESDILATQRVDYRTGKLITNKPFSMSCS